MEANVGSMDRNVRIAIGFVLGVVGAAVFVGPLADLGTVVGAVALVAGIVLLGTGLTRQCLLYRPFGINTCER